MDTTTLGITIGLGLILFVIYYHVFGKHGGGYITHPAWLGLSANIVKMLCVLQVFAAIGFLVSVGTWVFVPPTSGIGVHLHFLIALFLVSAITWPIALKYGIGWLVVLSLVMTAAGSILLLAASIEDETPKWWVILGFILLNVVTVLVDAVMWNAKFILADGKVPSS